MGGPTMSGTLGSIASSFGLDLTDMQSSDAITPLLYPDLMEDNGFVTGLFNVQVKDKKGQLTTTYHDYLKNHHQGPWWSRAMNWVENLFKKDEVSKTKEDIDPYNLTKSENNIAGMIRNDVSVSVNKKTGVISIEVEAQDPLICKIVADSVTEHLQHFITDYRTSKARTDFEYYSGLAKDAKQEYETVRRKYGSLSDANTKVSMKSVELMLEDYENDMQLKFNAYTAINTQLQAAKAKVQENTPAFTILKGASVPIRPAGPKRMIFVALMLFLASIAISLYIIRDLIFKE
jgi:uncharacterized protein involved in exopolysaccharide biosynthesis